jgi:hypothetical protein
MLSWYQIIGSGIYYNFIAFEICDNFPIILFFLDGGLSASGQGRRFSNLGHNQRQLKRHY